MTRGEGVFGPNANVSVDLSDPALEPKARHPVELWARVERGERHVEVAEVILGEVHVRVARDAVVGNADKNLASRGGWILHLSCESLVSIRVCIVDEVARA